MLELFLPTPPPNYPTGFPNIGWLGGGDGLAQNAKKEPSDPPQFTWAASFRI